MSIVILVIAFFVAWGVGSAIALALGFQPPWAALIGLIIAVVMVVILLG